MNRRHFIYGLGGLAIAPVVFLRLSDRNGAPEMSRTVKVVHSEKEWQGLLSEAQFQVLRTEGTERPWSSPLNGEKRPGTYVCAGCKQPLFTAQQKFDSGTGWPSFFDVIEDAVGTKTDFKLILPRTEYHCSRCGGHQGHVFKDGPPPTGLRYCNNGVALNFIPEQA